MPFKSPEPPPLMGEYCDICQTGRPVEQHGQEIHCKECGNKIRTWESE